MIIENVTTLVLLLTITWIRQSWKLPWCLTLMIRTLQNLLEPRLMSLVYQNPFHRTRKMPIKGNSKNLLVTLKNNQNIVKDMTFNFLHIYVSNVSTKDASDSLLSILPKHSPSLSKTNPIAIIQGTSVMIRAKQVTL